MKAYTDLEQSKKLAEILPLESADMCYIEDKPNIGFLYKEYKEFGDTILQNYYPCWSLAALLKLFDDKAGIAKEYGTWFAYDNGKSHCTKHYDNPIDSAFDMIIKLHDLNLL